MTAEMMSPRVGPWIVAVLPAHVHCRNPTVDHGQQSSAVEMGRRFVVAAGQTRALGDASGIVAVSAARPMGPQRFGESADFHCIPPSSHLL
jgi:hypothetical protein